MIEKARQDLERNIRSSDQIRVDDRREALIHVHESKGKPRGERDVIRLRTPTEDKRAFRRMLTSAEPTKMQLKFFWREIAATNFL